jgi:hypothetical protein
MGNPQRKLTSTQQQPATNFKQYEKPFAIQPGKNLSAVKHRTGNFLVENQSIQESKSQTTEGAEAQKNQ